MYSDLYPIPYDLRPMHGTQGNTCLHYCFGYNYNELGEYLITKGADPNIKNKIGATCR
jgi:hypothetical protein